MSDRRVRFALVTVLSACAAVCALEGGCYTTSPQLWETSTDTFSYESTPMRPVTITLIDTRTDEAFFRMEVPVGQQLSFHFDETGGDDVVLRPARMSWEVFETGSSFASLTNLQSCPPAGARRIEYAVRAPGEYAPQPPEAPMRVEDSAKPEWSTSKGGPVGNNRKLYE